MQSCKTLELGSYYYNSQEQSQNAQTLGSLLCCLALLEKKRKKLFSSNFGLQHDPYKRPCDVTLNALYPRTRNSHFREASNSPAPDGAMPSNHGAPTTLPPPDPFPPSNVIAANPNSISNKGSLAFRIFFLFSQQPLTGR